MCAPGSPAGATPQIPSLRLRVLPMQDMTMLFFTALFFGVAFLYVKALQKLR